MRKVTLFCCACLAVMIWSSHALAQNKLQKVKVGIIQLLENNDFDVMRENFLTTLKKKGYDPQISYFNADVMKYPEIFVQRGREAAEKMVKEGVDLFFAPGMYLHLGESTGDIPLFDTTLYVTPATMGAFMKKDNRTYCKSNATGVYLTYPFLEIVKFARDIMPKAKKIAYLHNPKSPVDRPIEEFADEAKKFGFSVASYPFSNATEAIEALKKAKNNSDLAFANNDIFVVDAHQKSIDFANDNQYALLFAIIPLVNAGGLASFQLDWAHAGMRCGDMAVETIKGKKANSLPVEASDVFQIGINLSTAKTLGLKIPYSWIELATTIVK